MVIDPVPTGATAIDPPEPVLMVAAADAAVSRLTVRLALLTLPESTEIALAPALASTMPPLVKFNVGELNVRFAPEEIS
jgi:hypothetical protein